jgi:hypothetical protein
LPNVVDPADLPAATAIAGSAYGTMAIVGASLGGVVSSAFGPYASFGVTVGCLLLAVVLTVLIRRPMQSRPPSRPSSRPSSPVAPQRSWPALVEGARYVVGHRRILALVTVRSGIGLGNGVLTVFPLLAGLHGAGAVGTGALFALRGAGAVIGPILVRPVLGRRSWLLPGAAALMWVYAVAYIGVAFSPWFWLVLVLVFVAHLAGGTNWLVANYALQGETPDQLRGRVFATDMMLATLSIAVSQLGAGAFVDRVDERVILVACGLITLTYAVGWRIGTRKVSLVGPPAVETDAPAIRSDRP